MISLPKRKTARAIIVQDGKVLLFLRRRKSRKTGRIVEYYSIPGGGIDPGETAAQAAIRELKEEMSVDIQLECQVSKHVSKWFDHTVFEASIVKGTPQLHYGSEEAQRMHEHNHYEVVWVPVSKLNETNLRYYAPFLPAIQHIALQK